MEKGIALYSARAGIRSGRWTQRTGSTGGSGNLERAAFENASRARQATRWRILPSTPPATGEAHYTIDVTDQKEHHELSFYGIPDARYAAVLRAVVPYFDVRAGPLHSTR